MLEKEFIENVNTEERGFIVVLLACFLQGVVGKESACNAGDSGSIPGLGRSAGEGIVFFSTHSSILGHPLWLNW